ncbi:MAG: HK97 family phage prohead protease [Rhizobiales bacterium]|jgi:HK97 family phage prohead protease|nr:HK97 family phage prohead protease [Hyphomicrobiales bacterium]
MERIEIKADLRVDEKANTVEGLAWLYAKPDKVGDIIVKGAIRPAATELPMLLEHKTGQLIGLWTSIEDRTDGLYVKGQFNETVLARGVRSQIITGRRNGLSIAFYTKASKRQGKNRVITAADMVEVSVVERPSHPGAQLTHVKTLNQAEALAAAINRASAHLRG